MWVDNVSEIDILNYQPYCNVLMDILYDPDIDNLKKELIKEVEDGENKLKNIRLFRKFFEEILEESKLEKLLIIIDDLD